MAAYYSLVPSLEEMKSSLILSDGPLGWEGKYTCDPALIVSGVVVSGGDPDMDCFLVG